MKPPPTGRRVPNSLCSPAEVSGHALSTTESTLDISDDSSALSSINTDIEDALELPLKKRKHRAGGSDTLGTSLANLYSYTTKLSAKPNASSPRRHPARTIIARARSPGREPTSEWGTVYAIVKEMREKNPTAPVDTMGCAELYWRASSPRDRRFQTLIALMLSSQTKDTVTAEAMQRLHTLLGEHTGSGQIEQDASVAATPVDSTLNLENILIVSPQRLNELIRTVGFHNNKTKYIKESATILRDQYNSDIPSTAKELMKLPGVGPKMAYLCMSAAWGKDEGIGVDVHVHRITNLWGWHKTKTPEETRKALESWLPMDKWHEINKLLVGLGQTICLPIGRRCGECALSGKNLCEGEVKSSRKRKNMIE